MTPELSSSLAPLQALALIVSPKLGLRHLSYMKDRIPDEMKKVLILPMIKHELLATLEAMAMEKL